MCRFWLGRSVTSFFHDERNECPVILNIGSVVAEQT
jgi:hypothetical protein